MILLGLNQNAEEEDTITDLLNEYNIDESAHFKLSVNEDAEESFKALASATF